MSFVSLCLRLLRWFSTWHSTLTTPRRFNNLAEVLHQVTNDTILIAYFARYRRAKLLCVPRTGCRLFWWGSKSIHQQCAHQPWCEPNQSYLPCDYCVSQQCCVLDTFDSNCSSWTFVGNALSHHPRPQHSIRRPNRANAVGPISNSLQLHQRLPQVSPSAIWRLLSSEVEFDPKSRILHLFLEPRCTRLQCDKRHQRPCYHLGGLSNSVCTSWCRCWQIYRAPSRYLPRLHQSQRHSSSGCCD